MTHHAYQPHHPAHQYGYPPAAPPQQPVFAPVTNQPQVQSTNVVVNTGGGGGSYRKRDWSTQLCGCCEDIGNCVCVMMCGCFYLCSLSTRLEEIVCLPCLVPQSLMALRVKVRESNNIAGSIFMDCVVTTCCPTMALCQMIRELDNIDRNKPGTQL